MAVSAILIANSPGGLQAVADQAGVVILPDTVQEFDGLSTFLGPGYGDVGEIDTAKSGWIALGEPRD